MIVRVATLKGLFRMHKNRISLPSYPAPKQHDNKMETDSRAPGTDNNSFIFIFTESCPKLQLIYQTAIISSTDLASSTSLIEDYQNELNGRS